MKKEENKAKGKEERLCQAVYKQEQRVSGSWTFKEGAILKRKVHFNLGRGVSFEHKDRKPRLLIQGLFGALLTSWCRLELAGLAWLPGDNPS